ncbi:MAG: hypothetical protein IJ805_00675 [Lachnospiraceae bacterium]|nr:hypothetical protein [Lachnospiraceae bacterium]
MKLNHLQFEPSINRVRPIAGDAANLLPRYTGVPQSPIDPDDPYKNTFTGLFYGNVTDENGKERQYMFYIPSTMKPSGSTMLVFIPGKTEPEDFFISCAWEQLLEETEITAFFISATEGWNLDDPGYEIDTASKVFAMMRANEYFIGNNPATYTSGFGDGAKIAAVFSILYSCLLAGWGACGDTSLPDELLEKLGNAPCDCDSNIPKKEVGLPAYFCEPRLSSVFNYYHRANKSEELPVKDGDVDVYCQKKGLSDVLLNDECCRELRYHKCSGCPSDKIVREIVSFLYGFKCWGGTSYPDIRRNEELYRDKFILYDKTIDGLKRRWRIFTPGSYESNRSKKRPLVVAIHGFTCSGPFFAENSDWHKVAQARDFFVVYPTAYPRKPVQSVSVRSGFSAGMPPANTWRTSLDIGISAEPLDDVSFISQMLDDIESEFPIDKERIYVTGHSNGSAMTQELMRRIPGRFAGFCGVGFMECLNEVVYEPDDGMIRNIWYIVGEHDLYDGSLEGDNWNTRTLKMICASDNIAYDLSNSFECGPYSTTVFYDDRKRPLVMHTQIKNFPHSYTPELSFKIYDEFFCHYRRSADGKLIYNGDRI